MALINTGQGAPIKFTVGRTGEQPSLIKARIASAITDAPDKNGRPAKWATVITEQTALSTGEVYLGERVQNLQYAYDRFEDEHSELLDGPKDSPKSIFDLMRERQAASLEFAMSRPVGGSVNLTDPVE